MEPSVLEDVSASTAVDSIYIPLPEIDVVQSSSKGVASKLGLLAMLVVLPVVEDIVISPTLTTSLVSARSLTTNAFFVESSINPELLMVSELTDHPAISTSEPDQEIKSEAPSHPLVPVTWAFVAIIVTSLPDH